MVEEGVMKAPLGLNETCNYLCKSKRSRRRLPLPARYVLAVPLLSRRTLTLSRNMIEAGLAVAD
jgi:hypothetical protein